MPPRGVVRVVGMVDGGDARGLRMPRCTVTNRDRPGVVDPGGSLAEDRGFAYQTFAVGDRAVSKEGGERCGHADREKAKVGFSECDAVATRGWPEGGLQLQGVFAVANWPKGSHQIVFEQGRAGWIEPGEADGQHAFLVAAVLHHPKLLPDGAATLILPEAVAVDIVVGKPDREVMVVVFCSRVAHAGEQPALGARERKEEWPRCVAGKVPCCPRLSVDRHFDRLARKGCDLEAGKFFGDR